jgi:hypothetical protein
LTAAAESTAAIESTATTDEEEKKNEIPDDLFIETV